MARVIRPRTRRRSKAGSCCTKSATAAGSRPYLLGSAEVLTCTNTSSVRSSSSSRCCSASATRRLSSAWNSLAKRATYRALLVCRWPMTDQCTPRSAIASALRCASCTLFSPSSWQPAATAMRMRASSTVLLTGSRRTLAGSRPARAQALAMRWRTVARLATICSTDWATGQSAGARDMGHLRCGVARVGYTGTGQEIVWHRTK
ncbi:hypothetical protein D3C73_930760 [compost metagenome]